MFDYDAAKAAAEQRRKEQIEAFNASLNDQREQEQKRQAVFVNAFKAMVNKHKEQRRKEAEKQAEQEAETVRQKVLDKYKKDTGQDAITEGYRKLVKGLFHSKEE